MRRYRIAVDTGGTFTDVVVADDQSIVGLFKSSTTKADMYVGIREAIEKAARHIGLDIQGLLRATSSFIYSTTRSTNAIIEGETAKTALITTAGHPDVLLYKEGGRTDIHNLSIPFPRPFIPRHLTFEVVERVRADGSIAVPLDERSLDEAIKRILEENVESIAVGLLWSIRNPEHELRIGARIKELAPHIPFSLSHKVNPIVREYRRMSATALDAALKPLMSVHLKQIDDRLRADGFCGRPLMVTHLSGGVLPLQAMCEHPVQTIDSGPTLAPGAGLAIADSAGLKAPNLIVIDAGGTSFEVSLIREGAIAYTREKWLGERWLGHMTGLPAVEVKSIGAGGGSIAYVDSGGLLRVGPKSAGSEPGPACYGRGGEHPTITDAAVVLGYIDPDYFLGGQMALNSKLAWSAVSKLAGSLGKSVEDTAEAILSLASENMRGLIVDMTISQGVDPRSCIMIVGGGAAGLNALSIARALQIPEVLIPRLAAGLSATGGHYSDLMRVASAAGYTTTKGPDLKLIAACVDRVRKELFSFTDEHGSAGTPSQRLFCEARYEGQLWDIDVDATYLMSPHRDEDFGELKRQFDAQHLTLFSVNDPGKDIEIIGWRGEARLAQNKPKPFSLPGGEPRDGRAQPRRAYFKGVWCECPVWKSDQIGFDAALVGPAIVLDPTTTIVVPEGATLRANSGYYKISIDNPEGDA